MYAYQVEGRFLDELLEGVDPASVFAGVATGSMVVAAEGLLGGYYGGLWRSFKNQIADGNPGAVVLFCRACCHHVIRCPRCGYWMAIARATKAGELVECGTCTVRINPQDRSDEMDAFLGTRTG
jgi:hypothetical protein